MLELKLIHVSKKKAPGLNELISPQQTAQEVRNR